MSIFSNYLTNHRSSVYIGFLTLILCLGIGYIIFRQGDPDPTSSTAPIPNCESHRFINQTLDCGLIDENIFRIRNIDMRIRNIIEEEVKKNNITRASVFYRDLTTRRWFGIDDTVNFYGASLLKLPLSIIYFKFAEVAPDILTQKFDLPLEERNEKEFFPSMKKMLVPGTEYTVKELIEGMLIDSDNNPVPVLNAHIDPSFRSSILHDLGIEQPITDVDSPELYINVRIYSNILRFLYNASYLNLVYSDTLLEFLSRTTFNEGIGAVIPPEIPVAHKFGEATKFASDGSVESRILHDCGIVYAPHNPYIICIMTEGKDYTNMSHVIQRIAEATYQF